MALDSDDERIRWHRPATPRDALHQVCVDFPIIIVAFIGSIGEFVWNRIIKKVWICSCFGFQQTHHVPLDRPTSITILRTCNPKLVKRQQEVAEQSQFALYTILPAEIRTLIFEFALFGDGNVVHVYKRRKQITHFRCKGQVKNQPCTYENPCSAALPFRDPELPNGYNIPSPHFLFHYYQGTKFEPDSAWGVVALMRTCRQVYYDVASLLYTKTHFHFPHPTDLALFSSIVAKDMLESIKIVSFDVGDFDTGFSIEATDQVSAGTSTVSSGLKGLKELRVFVKKWIDPISTAGEVGDSGRVELEGESIGGMVLGCNVKEKEGLDVFQIIVPGGQRAIWETLLAGKRGIELCVYHDDTDPEGLEGEGVGTVSAQGDGPAG